MALKPDDLWDFHTLVASYVMPTKKLCEALLKVPVDKVAVLKRIAKIQPSPKLHNRSGTTHSAPRMSRPTKKPTSS